MDYVSTIREATNGSPFVLRSLGRLYGLGDVEQNLVATRGVPGWIWFSVALAAGFVIGARVQAQWPDKLPRLVSGK